MALLLPNYPEPLGLAEAWCLRNFASLAFGSSFTVSGVINPPILTIWLVFHDSPRVAGVGYVC